MRRDKLQHLLAGLGGALLFASACQALRVGTTWTIITVALITLALAIGKEYLDSRTGRPDWLDALVTILGGALGYGLIMAVATLPR